jgi:hypothetical protein
MPGEPWRKKGWVCDNSFTKSLSFQLVDAGNGGKACNAEFSADFSLNQFIKSVACRRKFGVLHDIGLSCTRFG